MTASAVVLAVALLAAVPSAPDVVGVERAVADAARRWDADAAAVALGQARSLARREPSERTRALHVRAGLAAAELLRVRFEETPPAETTARQTLGSRIDAAAEEALQLLAAQPETSERYRVEADLVATLIRSDFRAKKHEARFKAAVARARELDPGNARALVSAAKPLLFAPEGHGRDVGAGIALLDEALRLDASLEAALLLRAHAREMLGNVADAQADWRAALALNPDCAPARRALGAATR